jgi:hypothetical protein
VNVGAKRYGAVRSSAQTTIIAVSKSGNGTGGTSQSFQAKAGFGI